MARGNSTAEKRLLISLAMLSQVYERQKNFASGMEPAEKILLMLLQKQKYMRLSTGSLIVILSTLPLNIESLTMKVLYFFLLLTTL